MKYNLKNHQKVEKLIENWTQRDRIIAYKMYSEFIEYLKEKDKLIIKDEDYFVNDIYCPKILQTL